MLNKSELFYIDKIIELIKQDALRSKALDCVLQLNLPQCYLAAGFVRNLIWDHLHNKPETTPLNDVDVIYFDHNESDNNYLDHEATLKTLMPELNWEVRNQVFMNDRNNDSAYINVIDAMSFWPEKETAVAIRKTENNNYECISAFGFQSLFEKKISFNPKREQHIIEHRIHSKNWLSIWPNLEIVKNKSNS